MKLAVFAVSAWCGVAAAAAAQQAGPPPQKPPEQTAPAPAPAQPKIPSFELDEEEEPAPAGGQKQTPSFEFEDEEPAPRNDAARTTYTGWRKCVRCHEKQSRVYVEGPHAREWDARTPAADIGCERCHGPGLAHDLDPGAKGLIVGFTRTRPRDVNTLCLECHDKQQHAAWSTGMHDARNVSCIDCHSVHRPKSEAGHLKAVNEVATCATCHREKSARMQRSAHMPVREGKMTCSACHNAHGSGNTRLLRTGSTVNESCLSCHAEKRGPFLWDHAPVRESCVTCHDSHGSSNERMLVAKTTMLCQRCHVHTRHPATPYDGLALASRSNRLVGRSCATCHPAIHGSNHPSGQFFMR
jgi:DmsE family decaheme c-type cytochrome